LTTPLRTGLGSNPSFATTFRQDRNVF